MAMTLSGSNGITFNDASTQSTGKQACKAWVNFNGTGTVAIRDSFNVSSITDNGTGDYTINFTTAMANANYSLTGSGYRVSGSYVATCVSYGTQTTTSCPVQLITDTGGLADSAVCSFAVFSS